MATWFRTMVCLAGIFLVAGSAAADPIYNPANGHYYEMITNGGSWSSWSEARAIAQSKSYAGLQGDLLTITSTEEYDFIVSNGSTLLPNWGVAWVGATVDSQGDAYWINGEGAIDTGIISWNSGGPGTDNFVGMIGPGPSDAYDLDGRTNDCGEAIVEYAPEPASLGLLAMGSAFLLRRRRRK